MLDDMLAETPERLSSGATDVITPKAANGTKDAAAERAASERWATTISMSPRFHFELTGPDDLAGSLQSDSEGPHLLL